MRLEKTGVNCISPEMKAMLPKLKPGETKKFQMLGGVPNFDPDPTEREKRPMLFGWKQIPTYDTIRDWHTGDHVIIAVVQDFEPSTGALVKSRTFVPNQGLAQNPGIFMLIGGNIEHEELYEHFVMSNYNQSNPHRDISKDALFYEINPEATGFKPIPKPIQVVQQPESLDIFTYNEKGEKVILKSGSDIINQPEKEEENTEELAEKKRGRKPKEELVTS